MATEIEHAERTGFSKWGRRIGIIFGVLLVLLVAVYFIGTSSAFIKGVVFPKVGKSLNSDLTAESVSLSPFSQVYIKGLKLQPHGAEPLLTAAEARVRYGLMDIIRGTIRVDELTLTSPVIDIVKNSDGTSNLDPVTKGGGGAKDTARAPKEKHLAIKNVSLKDGTVRITEKLKGGGTKQTELTKLNITLDQLVTGAPGKLSLNSDFVMANRASGGTNDVARGNLNGVFELMLDGMLKPQKFSGTSTLKLAQGDGAYKDYAGFNATLDADVTPTEIRQASVRFGKAEQRFGELRVAGTFNPETMEGRLTQTVSVDKNMLNLVGAGKGLNFQDSSVASTNIIDLSKKGTFIAIVGGLDARNIKIVKDGRETPSLSLGGNYQLTVDRADTSAVIQKLAFEGTQNSQPFLRTILNRPMNLSWGNSVPGFTESALQVVLTNFNIAQWSAVIGTNSPTGVASGTINLLAQQEGKILKTDLAAEVNDLAAQVGTNTLRNARVTLAAEGSVDNLRIVNLQKYEITVQQQGSPLVHATGAVRYDLQSKEFSGQASADANVASVLKQFPVDGAAATQGTAALTAAFSVGGGKTQASGTMALRDFNGKFQKYVLEQYQVTLDYNVDLKNDILQIYTATISLAQAFAKGGSLDLTGTYGLKTKKADLKFTLGSLNESGLRPFLAPSLGDNKLVSINLNSSGSAAYDPAGETQIKADVAIENWVVQDAAKKLPATPLAVKLQLDAGLNKSIVDLRQLGLQLTPTDRAKNELSLKGRIDTAKTNASPGTLTIQSDSLDVTPYYEMFAGAKEGPAKGQSIPAASKPVAETAATPAKDPNKEPDPMTLLFQDFTAKLDVGKFFLRQIAISNLTANAQIKNGEVRIDPLQLSLNGAPVSAKVTLNLGVPGYKYDLTFDAAGVPIEPVMNSLAKEPSGQMKGLLTAKANIKGAGTTGASMQKNLQGSTTFVLTNMNVQVVSPKWRNILEPIALVLNLPELTQTPLDWLSSQTEIGNGNINLRQTTVQSAAYQANIVGSIPIDQVLTNSPLNLPLSLSLSHSLAQKARIPIADTKATNAYVKLPDFVTVNGTIGKPGAKINKLAIAGILAQSTGLTDKLNQALPPSAGNVVNSLLGTTTPAANPANTNAAPASTNSAKENLIRGIGGLLGGATKSSTAPATNAPPATNKPARANAIGDLLKGLGK